MLYSSQSQNIFGSVVYNTNQSAIQNLYSDPRVLTIYADTISYPTTTQYSPTWGLDRIDQTNLPLNNEYTYGSNGSGVNVFVIDSGINSSHPEFAGKSIPEVDFSESSQQPIIPPPCTPANCSPPIPVTPTGDTLGHGTHVSATIGGLTYGVAKNVNLHSIKIFADGGAPYSVIIEALIWLNDEIDNNNNLLPAIVNMSYGGNSNNSTAASLYQSLTNKGLLLIAAAGNSNSNTCGYPAIYNNVISVGASTINDYRAPFSNKGSCVDLFAPGENILSANYTGGYTTKSGTSMATPHVVGASALYLQNHASTPPSSIKSLLLSSASNITLHNAGSGSPDKLLNISQLSPVNTSSPDDYDNISIRGYADDYEGDAESIIANGAIQTHNFHDAGDQDWTMVWASSPINLIFSTQSVGSNSSTKTYIYKVTSAIVNPNYPGTNRFIIQSKQLVASDTNGGNSYVPFTAEANFLYIMKTISATNAYGSNTEYTSQLDFDNSVTPDDYDNISIRGYTDDDEGDAESIIANGAIQTHNFHDAGDQDWTMVWASSPINLIFSTQSVGSNSSTKTYIYKVTSAIVNPNYPGTNRFIIQSKQLVASDTNGGNSYVPFTAEANFLYIMKTISATNAYGSNTEYTSQLDFQ